MRRHIPTLLALCALALPPGAARAQQNAPEFCRRAGTDDRLRPIPLSLVPQAQSLFGTTMPAEMAQRSTVFRCLRGRTLICNMGANLPCGKANTTHDNPGAIAWCKDNPNSDFIPIYAVGHDTIYRWRCTGGRAQIVSQQDRVDERGFVARYWKQLR